MHSGSKAFQGDYADPHDAIWKFLEDEKTSLTTSSSAPMPTAMNQPPAEPHGLLQEGPAWSGWNSGLHNALVESLEKLVASETSEEHVDEDATSMGHLYLSPQNFPVQALQDNTPQLTSAQLSQLMSSQNIKTDQLQSPSSKPGVGQLYQETIEMLAASHLELLAHQQQHQQQRQQRAMLAQQMLQGQAFGQFGLSNEPQITLAQMAGSTQMGMQNWIGHRVVALPGHDQSKQSLNTGLLPYHVVGRTMPGAPDSQQSSLETMSLRETMSLHLSSSGANLGLDAMSRRHTVSQEQMSTMHQMHQMAQMTQSKARGKTQSSQVLPQWSNLSMEGLMLEDGPLSLENQARSSDFLSPSGPLARSNTKTKGKEQGSKNHWVPGIQGREDPSRGMRSMRTGSTDVLNAPTTGTRIPVSVHPPMWADKGWDPLRPLAGKPVSSDTSLPRGTGVFLPSFDEAPQAKQPTASSAQKAAAQKAVIQKQQLHQGVAVDPQTQNAGSPGASRVNLPAAAAFASVVHQGEDLPASMMP